MRQGSPSKKPYREIRTRKIHRHFKNWTLGIAVAIATLAVLSTASAQVGPAGLVFWGDRVVKETIASTAPITQISAGDSFMVALRADGSAVAWGADQVGQCDLPKGLTGITQVAAGKSHVLMLMKNGTVRATGWDNYFQADVPAG